MSAPDAPAPPAPAPDDDALFCHECGVASPLPPDPAADPACPGCGSGFVEQMPSMTARRRARSHARAARGGDARFRGGARGRRGTVPRVDALEATLRMAMGAGFGQMGRGGGG
jgi:hypothetical protein